MPLLPSGNGAVLPGGYILRPATAADLPATARAHVRLLPVGLFPALGARFVRRWHRTYLSVPHSVALVVVDPAAREHGVVGFLLGSTDQAAQTAALLGNRRLLLGLAVAGTLALLRRPRLAVQFLRTRAGNWLRRLLRRPAPDPEGPGSAPVTVAVLAAIAVEPGARRHGLGAHLVGHFLQLARRGPADVAELVTEADGGPTFYERLGWEPRGERVTRDGMTVHTYAYQLADAPTASPADDGRTSPTGEP